MTKKQLKQLAKKIANLEYTIKTSSDKDEIDHAKKEMVKTTDSADLSLEDMLSLDEYVQTYMEEKNI